MIKRPFSAYRGAEPFCFVSYAHSDAEAVYPLLEGLRELGTNIWYDEGIEPGSDWRDELAAAIDTSASVVYFVSAASVASSNCLKEINFTLSRNKPIVLVYLESVELPAGLELSLGGQQGIVTAQHEQQTVLDKMHRAIHAPSPLAMGHRPKLAATAKPRRWPMFAVLALAGLALLAWYNSNRQELVEEAATQRTGPPVIAVTPFNNLSGDADLDWFGGGVATLVSDQLAGSRHMILVSNSRWSNVSAGAESASALREQVRKAGISHLVSGEIVPSPDGLLLSVRTTDIESGVNIGAQSVDSLSRETLIAVSREVSRNIMQTLNLPREKLLQTLSADFMATNFAAYEAYLAGLQLYNRFDYDQAEVSMHAALAIAPDFHMANFRLANIYMTKNQWRKAEETLAKIPQDADLPERERTYITGLGHMTAGAYPKAIELFEQWLQRAPYDVEGQQFLAESYYRNFQADKALTVLDALSEQEPENHHAWAAMGYISMSLGYVERAERALGQYAVIAPDLPHPWQLLGTLAMHQQAPEQAEEYFNRALALEAGFAPALLGISRANAYLGNYPAAQATLSAMLNNKSATVKDRVSAAFDLVGLLQAMSQFGGVETVLSQAADPIAQDKIRIALALTERAYAAMARGDLDSAQDLVFAAVAQAPPEGVPTRYLFARGILEVLREEFDSVAVTTAAIRSHSLPADDPDQTEERAALLLEGLVLAKQGKFALSVNKLTQAKDTNGFEYRSVALALARSYSGSGNLTAALASSFEAVQERPQFQAPEPRLDLEIERRRALELAVQLACELNDKSAQAQVRELSVPAWQAPLNCSESRR